jgi:hypothetical protein
MVLGREGDIVYIVSVSDWSIMKEVKVTSSSIHALRFSRSDERLAVGCSDGVLALLSPEDVGRSLERLTPVKVAYPALIGLSDISRWGVLMEM